MTIISIVNKTTRFSLTVLMLLIATFCYAQPGSGDGPPGGGPQTLTTSDIADIQTAWMKKKLKLSKEQVDKVKEINKEFVAKKQELQKADKKQTEKLTEPEKERNDKLKTILSEKQFARFLVKKSELDNSMSSSGNTVMPPPPPPGGGFQTD